MYAYYKRKLLIIALFGFSAHQESVDYISYVCSIRCGDNRVNMYIPHNLAYKIMLCQKIYRAIRHGFFPAFSDLAIDGPIRL